MSTADRRSAAKRPAKGRTSCDAAPFGGDQAHTAEKHSRQRQTERSEVFGPMHPLLRNEPALGRSGRRRADSKENADNTKYYQRLGKSPFSAASPILAAARRGKKDFHKNGVARQDKDKGGQDELR